MAEKTLSAAHLLPILNRNPDNFFSQVEQAAFCPANLVTGIEFSDDKLLQGRTLDIINRTCWTGLSKAI